MQSFRLSKNITQLLECLKSVRAYMLIFILGDFIFVNRTGSSSSHHLTTMLLSSKHQSTFLHSLTEEISENLFIQR